MKSIKVPVVLLSVALVFSSCGTWNNTQKGAAIGVGGGAAVGAGVGAALGLLFAPKKGSETREDLKRMFDDLLNKVKNLDMDDVRETVELKIEEIKQGNAELQRNFEEEVEK